MKSSTKHGVLRHYTIKTLELEPVIPVNSINSSILTRDSLSSNRNALLVTQFLKRQPSNVLLKDTAQIYIKAVLTMLRNFIF